MKTLKDAKVGETVKANKTDRRRTCKNVVSWTWELPRA